VSKEIIVSTAVILFNSAGSSATGVTARGVRSPGGRFESLSIQRRLLGPRDVAIDIAFSGICHSDICAVESAASYPLVPGHEIAGIVTAVGADAARRQRLAFHRRDQLRLTLCPGRFRAVAVS
jgi:hypothetical protein